jgi:acetoin utilization protein AcuC
MLERGNVSEHGCRLGVAYGKASNLYSFPGGHPLNNKRIEIFARSLESFKDRGEIQIYEPQMALEPELLEFHEREYVSFVKKSSATGSGYLDYGDTPSFKGVYEASLFTVGGTLIGLKEIAERRLDHFFNPVGGLHHAKRDAAGGFCVFDDPAVAIAKALRDFNFKKVAYVDIDAHHGDGVFYGYEKDPRVLVGDIHEDGRFLYPGSGFANETGLGEALGTKMNIPLPPGSGDDKFFEAFDKIIDFLKRKQVEFIFFQCGADGLAGDPLTHLKYSQKAHAYAAKKLHELCHEVCEGRILAMGGGGYEPRNVDSAWSAVVRELSSPITR